MRLGIGSYTYPWSVGVSGYPAPAQPLSAAALLERAATLGLRVVQVADNLPLHHLAAAELETLRGRAEELGITWETGTIGIEEDNLRRYLAISRSLRARILRTVIDTATEHPTPDEVVARLRPLMPEFERAGVILAVENHDRFKAATLRDILERVGGSSGGPIGVCLDTANSLGCMEGAEQVVATLGPRVVSLHIKDVAVFRPPHRMGFTVEGRAAGQGQIDVPALLRSLRDAGADPNAILELWSPPMADLTAAIAREEAWARQSLDYLRPLIPD